MSNKHAKVKFPPSDKNESMHAPRCCSFTDSVNEGFIVVMLWRHLGRGCRTLGGPRKPLLLFAHLSSASCSPNEQHRSFCHQTESDCSVALLLTSAGTRRLLPRCWLKERHQASVYPFMLGTYFFTVSSLSLSHTPSSLWI